MKTIENTYSKYSIKRTFAFSWLLILLCLTLLFASCTVKPKNITFNATIESVSGNSLMVTTSDPVSFDKASVSLADTKLNFQPEPGHKVEITIRPEIMESYPVQVFAVKVRLITK